MGWGEPATPAKDSSPQADDGWSAAYHPDGDNAIDPRNNIEDPGYQARVEAWRAAQGTDTPTNLNGDTPAADIAADTTEAPQ